MTEPLERWRPKINVDRHTETVNALEAEIERLKAELAEAKREMGIVEDHVVMYQKTAMESEAAADRLEKENDQLWLEMERIRQCLAASQTNLAFITRLGGDSGPPIGE